MRTMCCKTIPSIVKNGRETRHLCGNPECEYYMRDVNMWLWDDEPIQQKETKMSEAKDSETARLIQAALSGSRGEDQKRIAEQGVAFVETLLRKNNDYGSSVWKKPLLAPSTDVAAAILVRMTDKVERLISLQSKAAEVVSESFDDTMKDLGAYALLYLARPKDGQSKS